MTIDLNTHQEGCTPFKPCASCKTVSFLRKELTDRNTASPAQFDEFVRHFQEHGFEVDAHKKGCSPIEPCLNCKMLDKLRRWFKSSNTWDVFLSLYTTGDLPEQPWDSTNDSTKSASANNRPIHSFGFSHRVDCALKEANILTLGELCALNEFEVLRLPNLGRRSLSEIKENLHSVGRSLAGKK